MAVSALSCSMRDIAPLSFADVLGSEGDFCLFKSISMRFLLQIDSLEYSGLEKILDKGN